MATVSPSTTVSHLPAIFNPLPRPPPSSSGNPNFNRSSSSPFSSSSADFRRQVKFVPLVAVSSPQPCADEPSLVDKSLLSVEEAVSEEELWSAACLRVRTFNEFKDSFGIEAGYLTRVANAVLKVETDHKEVKLAWKGVFDFQKLLSENQANGSCWVELENQANWRGKDHKKYLTEREFEALKERVAGTREGFKRVSCINASLPLSHLSNHCYADLCSRCKFSVNGEERVVVGTLDVNNCLRLPDEITGMRPQGIGADFARAYLSNVCVAKELQRNGLGHSLISKSKTIAEEWGMTDLYVHVAVDNEPAKKLYMKSGFIYESDEPAWQARYLKRPRRILLWMGFSDPYNL